MPWVSGHSIVCVSAHHRACFHSFNLPYSSIQGASVLEGLTFTALRGVSESPLSHQTAVCWIWAVLLPKLKKQRWADILVGRTWLLGGTTAGGQWDWTLWGPGKAVGRRWESGPTASLPSFSTSLWRFSWKPHFILCHRQPFPHIIFVSDLLRVRYFTIKKAVFVVWVCDQTFSEALFSLHRILETALWPWHYSSYLVGKRRRESQLTCPRSPRAVSGRASSVGTCQSGSTSIMNELPGQLETERKARQAHVLIKLPSAFAVFPNSLSFPLTSWSHPVFGFLRQGLAKAGLELESSCISFPGA